MQKAFAFDFDGVVLDSLLALQEAYFEFLILHGKNGSIEEFNALNGPSLPEIILALKKKYSLKESHEVLFQNYISLLNKRYINAPLIDGIRECLLFLKRLNSPIALVTSSVRQVVQEILHKQNMLSMFDCIITGEEVMKSKPEPDIYLKLTEKFPDYSWFAIEDSENGIKAALTAELKTIFFDPSDIGTGQKVFSRVNSMSSLLRRFEELQFDSCVVDSFRDIRVELVESPVQHLSQEIIFAINKIWKDAQHHRTLHDGMVLYYVAHKTVGHECLISAFWAPYRYFYAKRSDPSLRIPIFPLAVSGICLNDDKQVLLGKRKGVSEYQDCFEFVPSGGLSNKNSAHNSVDYEQQLVDEFEEETKLDKFSISSIKTLGLVFDLDHNVFDICCLMVVISSAETLSSTSEYEELEWVDLNDTRINLAIPTSKVLLSLFRECQ